MALSVIPTSLSGAVEIPGYSPVQRSMLSGLSFPTGVGTITRFVANSKFIILFFIKAVNAVLL